MDAKRIAKIEKLENDFDLVRSVADDLDGALYDFAAVQRRIERLFQYQESGEWQKDFEADEKGELPKNMKRGILSEDALDELLTDVTLLRERMKEFLSDVKVGKNEELLGFEEYDPLVDELDPALNFDHESPELENFKKHLKFMMDNCIVDEDYEKVNTEEKIVRLPKKALKEFLSSDYGKAFKSDNEEYEFAFKAGDPELNKLIITLLEKYCGLTDKSKLVMKTTAEVFR